MKIILMSSGVVNILIGLIGVILPILPTTPFILLGLYLLSKSSPKIHDYMTSTTWYKKHIEQFVLHKTMTFQKKWTLLILVDLMLMITFINIDVLALQILIVVLVAYKHYYFYKYINVTY